MKFNILAINPGSTSTKIAVYTDADPILDITLRHTAEQIGVYPNVASQLQWRRDMILEALHDNGFEISTLSAVIGRGGILKPITGGVYGVNDTMIGDLENAPMEHASNLGGLIANDIANMAGVKAYIADPVVVDEMDDVARLSGLPECPRRSIFHALNQKAIARLHCKNNGLDYNKARLIVAHLGGGISVGVHRDGRVVDTNNALNGDGPFAPERAGTLPAGGVVELCFSGKYTQKELMKMLSGKGGMVAHINSNSVQQTLERVREGDQKAKAVIEAMCYNVAKEIGAMATVLKGEVDAIILTGGIIYNQPIIDAIKERCKFLAPIVTYPGENELEALAMNALAVLQKTVSPKIYK